MADRVDAGVDAMQTPAGSAVRGAPRAEPQRLQLSERDDTVLAPREECQPSVERQRWLA